jgi:PPOX class probable F420-dependent enzyme
MTASLEGRLAEFVASQRCVHLATVGADGRPHVVPISPVLDDGRICFATERDTKKVRNIVANPSVALSFDEYTEDWPALRLVVIHGDAEVVEAGATFSSLRALLYRKYAQYEAQAPIGDDDSVMIVVTPTRVVSQNF